MNTLLKFFKKFHYKLKNVKLTDLKVDVDEVIAKIKTDKGLETLVINFEKDKTGEVKFASIMIE